MAVYGFCPSVLSVVLLIPIRHFLDPHLNSVAYSNAMRLAYVFRDVHPVLIPHQAFAYVDHFRHRSAPP